MNVSKLISILTSVNAAEAVITANNGKLIVCSDANSVKTYAEIDSDIVLPQIIVDVSQLLEALKRAEGAELKLTYSDSKLTLKTNNMQFELSVKESNITIPTVPGDDCFETINFEGLKTAFTKVIGAVSKDKARPHLAAVNVDGHKIMATDSYVMSVYNMERVPSALREAKFTLSSDFVKHILKIGRKERVAKYLPDR